MVSIAYMVVADAAIAAEGKHYIHGGGWDTIWAVAFPAVHPSVGVALLVNVPWNETNAPFTLELDVVDADERSILPAPPGPLGGPMTVGRPANAVPGNALRVALTFTLNGLAFPAAGDYAFVAKINGEVGARFTIHMAVNASQTHPSMGQPG